ncbi:hypothetical protein HCN44_010668 [Aphidius gifuensis]|uniref:Tr-type G domain-containing protein n=1 Tax=Aphidius gifuensis TaxID=684658 RepID=A0A834XUI3_APHGI|nr:ribosome-releasing factor 2, mitochondrial [Aphidius gifuensis]KAF7991867.1 hypothetical protein HCN44_010668 [Aphidius gifuensis]
MLTGRIIKSTLRRIRYQNFHTDCPGGKLNTEKWDLTKIRNIGIMAHIDAGKTTTTERMLFYSGSISNMGEVHDGNTVTDCMEQERQRGITISSAAVTLNWKNYKFNIIDTPGHIDFTMGVEQTLGALDGAIVILDGSAGVEAQTTTVWRQADKYNIPRIVFINKMDRLDADYSMCLKSLESKFDIITLPLQIPIKNNAHKLEGVIDLLTLEKVLFKKDNYGRVIIRDKLNENTDEKLYEIAMENRRQLVDKLSNNDDDLADKIIEEESLDKISSKLIIESIRKTTLNKKAIPVLLGSSYKNIGVQPLMDAVILYLPSPSNNDKTKIYNCFEDNFSARVFKIVHDKQRGPITFFRVFTGKLLKGQKIYNIYKSKSEQGTKLYSAYADDYEEIEEVNQGNIGALAGLKTTTTGDLLTTNLSSYNNAKKKINQDDNNNIFIPTKIPDPVFFCSIELPSMSYQTALDIALQELEREDPSLRVTLNEETGQTVLSGMGELHIDIIKERIKSEYKIDVELGPLQIAYKETITNSIKDTFLLHHKIGTVNHDVNITMSLIPNYICNDKKDILLLDKSKDSASNIASIYPKTMSAVKLGVKSALVNGSKLGCPVINVGVKLHWLEVGRGTSDTMVSSAVSQCIRKMLSDAGSILLEPIMQLEIVVPEEYSSTVMNDLGRRRAQIQDITVRRNNKVLRALTPLSELLGYATNLRIITSGTGTFTLEFHEYQSMTSQDEQNAIKRVTGF